jgi:hypothetical protein
LPTFNTSVLGSFCTIAFLALVIVSPVAARTQATAPSNTGTVSVNVLFNYGNGTSIWINNTSVPSDANFFNVTTLVTRGNIGAVFFASFGSHFVYSINGVGCPASNIFCDQAWGFWTLDGICWDLPSVGVDQVTVSQATTVAWFLNPVATFGESPPTGANCVGVNLDVQPDSNQTTINPSSHAVIPVAILSTATFDATSVNPLTVKFGRTGTEASPVHWSFADVNGDGRVDIILDFRVQSTGIQAGDTQAVLMGRTLDGTPFRGFAAILTTGP